MDRTPSFLVLNKIDIYFYTSTLFLKYNIYINIKELLTIMKNPLIKK
jgi:hypothetical protein